MSFSADMKEVVAENRNGLLSAHSSWERIKLADVATILNGFAFKSAKFSKDKGTPLTRLSLFAGKNAFFRGGEVRFDQCLQGCVFKNGL